MQKCVVVFKSKYGSTEKYARWIAEELSAEIFKVNKIRSDKLNEYNTIIYCGGLYAGGILGFSFIKKNYNKFCDKNLIVAAVGATLKKGEEVEEVKNRNIPDEMKKNVKFFMLRGGLNYKKMNLLDRAMMYLLVKSITNKKTEELDNDSKGLLATYGKVVDFTSKNAIIPIINEIKSFEKL